MHIAFVLGFRRKRVRHVDDISQHPLVFGSGHQGLFDLLLASGLSAVLVFVFVRVVFVAELVQVEVVGAGLKEGPGLLHVHSLSSVKNHFVVGVLVVVGLDQDLLFLAIGPVGVAIYDERRRLKVLIDLGGENSVVLDNCGKDIEKVLSLESVYRCTIFQR